jgi:hypothetical protein
MMAGSALFTPGTGDFYIPVTVRLADLHRSKRLSAFMVYLAILATLFKGRTETSEAVTDKFLKTNTWLKPYSLRFIQKGLKILEEIGIIVRKHRYGTRRRIVVVGRLRGRIRVPPKGQGQAEPGEPKPKPKKKKVTPGENGSSRPHVARCSMPTPAATPEEIAAAAAVAAEMRARIAAECRAPAAPDRSPDPPRPEPRRRLAVLKDEQLDRELEERQRQRLAKLEAIPADRRTKYQEEERQLLAAQFAGPKPPGTPPNRSP